MVCGCMPRYPFVGDDLASLGRNVQAGSFKSIPTTLFSQELVDLIHSMLSLDAERRPTSTAICNMQWLFDFCLEDIKSFAGLEGGFEEEVANRTASDGMSVARP